MKQHEKNVDVYFLEMAMLVATRATCPRISAGCVLVSAEKHVLATGYNGVPSKLVHCTLRPCAQAHLPLGQPDSLCLAVHAEQNALIQCGDQHAVHTAYVTHRPCWTCIKMLINTSTKRLVFINDYKSAGGADVHGLWLSAERSWSHMQIVR